MTRQITLPSTLIALGLILMGMMIVLAFLSQTKTASASVARFAEYQATTTVTSSFAPEASVFTGAGTLGSIVVTGAAAGVMNIYDATTSNVTLRAASMSSSTILKATLPASAAAGTYTFDLLLTNGLYVSTVGTSPTTTITYRQN